MAEVLTFPRKRCVVSRNLNKTVIDHLIRVRHHGGADALDLVASNLVIGVCALFAHEHGRERLLALLDVVEVLNTDQPGA
jgi:hypothetical protein